MLQLTGIVSEVVANPAGKTRKGVEYGESATVQIIGRTVSFGVQKGAMFDVRIEVDDRELFQKVQGKRIRIWVEQYNERFSFVAGTPIEQVAAAM